MVDQVHTRQYHNGPYDPKRERELSEHEAIPALFFQVDIVLDVHNYTASIVIIS